MLVPHPHELARVGLAALWCRPRVFHPVPQPALAEARVEDAPGVAGSLVEVVGHRHRRDRREVRRPRAGDEQLADAGKRDPREADLAALHPRLRRHRLDRVVAVIGRRQVEEVEGAARAARAAHLHAHDGEVEHRRDQGADGRARGRREWVRLGAPAAQLLQDRVEEVVRSRHLVAGVLDQRRERPVGERLAAGSRTVIASSTPSRTLT